MTTKDVKAIADQLGEQPKMGDIKKLAKTIKKDHELALALWATGTFSLRMLAALIFDKTLIDQEFADSLADDLAAHDESEKNQITDWLLANQFTKSKNDTTFGILAAGKVPSVATFILVPPSKTPVDWANTTRQYRSSHRSPRT